MSDGLPTIDLYWRPGCPFCAMLDRGLAKTDLPIRRHNIWEDPDAAATVRSAAGGNETVPTVRVGEEYLVNPSAKEVVAAVVRTDPDLADRLGSEPGPIARLVERLSGPDRD